MFHETSTLFLQINGAMPEFQVKYTMIKELKLLRCSGRKRCKVNRSSMLGIFISSSKDGYFETSKTHLPAIKIPNTAPISAPIHGLDVMIQRLPLHLPKYPIKTPIIAPITAPIIYLIMALTSL